MVRYTTITPYVRISSELAEKVLVLTGSTSKIVFKPLPSDDPVQRCPDITLAQNSLDWSPTVSLSEGLVKTVAHFDSFLRNNGAINGKKK